MTRRARGSDGNPDGRFERLRHVPLDPEVDPGPALDESGEVEPAPDPRTRLLLDHSRSIVARNDSPDLGFEASVNPYRGCEHGCVYCLAPETPVLRADLTWCRIGDVRVGDELVGFDEFLRAGQQSRRLRKAVVENVWWSRKPVTRLVTDRAEVETTAEHRWLQYRNFRWSRTEQLRVGKRLRFLLPPTRWEPDADYRVGYVAGLSLGDGSFCYRRGWCIALIEREPLERCVEYMRRFAVELAIRPFERGPGSRLPLLKVETRCLAELDRVEKIIRAELDSESYRRGFLAGFFDAEGHIGTLRMSRLDRDVLARVIRYAASLGFELLLEAREARASAARLPGTIRERMRFLAAIRPAIVRQRERIFGCEPVTDPASIEALETGAVRDVVDIQTSTGTFYAAGLATHNCYARPTHEYLGMSAGLDFETRILVKRDAPELLRRALASPRWKPTVVALSGVTDPYQPAERRLRLTRRCLGVLAEFRNPVAVVTKGYTVTRDADLLAELASHSAASVSISLTTLDAELQRRMEPRASAPARRLAAIERLARAGIPVGVLVAPIIPGLSDHEIPALLDAAAAAGASFAGRVVLRLPHGLKQLFEDWLAQHYPERREKILARLRSLHGGRLYDPSFGQRQRGEGPFAEQIAGLFELARRRAGLAGHGPALSTAAFRRPGAGADQLRLF